MSTKLIVAADDKGGIGKSGGLPWKLPADLARFRQLTMGGTYIIGRRTWDSLPESMRLANGLPGRVGIVVSKSLPDGWDLKYPSVWLTRSMEHALRLAGDEGMRFHIPAETWIVGGAEIYQQALDLDMVDEIYLTRVRGDFGCDVFWSGVPAEGWGLVSTEFPVGHSSLLGPPAYQFEVWRRVR